MSFTKSYHLQSLCRLFIVAISLAAFFSCKQPKTELKATPQFEDRIDELKDKLSHTVDPKERVNLFHEVESLVMTLGKVQDQQKQYSSLKKHALKYGDSSLFYKFNYKSLAIAQAHKDSIAIGESYWDFGTFLLNKQYYGEAFHYYGLAQQTFSKIKHSYYEAKMWYNMAFIKGRLREYTASETYIYKALPYFIKEQKHKQIYRCYTLLAFIYEELEGYDEALTYLNQALVTVEEIPNAYFVASTYNNLGLIYHKKTHYDKALKHFNKALSIKEVKGSHPKLHARLIDNRAYTDFKGGYKQYEADFERALSIRKSIQNKAGIVISQLHLAEVLWKQKDTVKAIQLAKEAVQVAQQINLNRELMDGLVLLAELDPYHSTEHVHAWELVRKKIELNMRKQRHKVAKVQFKTQEIKGESERLKMHKQLLVLALTLGVLLSMTLYLYIRQKSRIKRIKDQRRQEYQLQLKKEEERNRIAADLHDGILSKLFGLRINWGMLDIKNDSNARATQINYLKTLKRLETGIRNLAHGLKEQETDISIKKSIKNTIQLKSQIGQFKYTFIYNDKNTDDALSQLLKKHLLAIIEEALQNVTKHSEASEVNILFHHSNQTIVLHIQDNGKGFDIEQYQKGIGLSNIKRRTEKINGSFKIKSTKDGTSIHIRIKRKYESE